MMIDICCILVPITGTSTGGILAAALGINGYDGERCVRVYEELIPVIFQQGWIQWILSKITRTAYNSKNLKRELKKHFPTPEKPEDKRMKAVSIFTLKSYSAWLQL